MGTTLIEQIKFGINWSNTTPESILDSFCNLLGSNEELYCKSCVSLKEAIEAINEIKVHICNLHADYYTGKLTKALDSAQKLLDIHGTIEIGPNFPFFRARSNESGFLYPSTDMFHIPFEKRYLIGNQRYSITGLPCLYLGGSPYICWEELNRPDYQRCNYCGVSNNVAISLYDLCLPYTISNIQDVKKIAIILACSIPANPSHIFKPQYVLPQCLLQAVIDKANSESETNYICGIRFYSTHFLSSDDCILKPQEYNTSVLDRYINYVLPALSNKREGYSENLLNTFRLSETVSIMNESIMDPFYMVGKGDDEYSNSLFGIIDNMIREKLKLPAIREPAQIYLCRV